MLKKFLGNKHIAEKCKLALLQMQLIHAEQNVHNCSKQATTQQSIATDIIESMNKTLDDNKIRDERVVDLCL